MSSCGAPEISGEVDQELLKTQAVIEGRVSLEGGPAKGYVRLLDSSDEFVAEVPLNSEGQYRFFARPASWKVKVILAGKTAENQVAITSFGLTNLDFTL